MDMKLGHPLTGPFYVRGAEPGDILEVEVLELVPDEFGTTCIIPGFGLLADDFPSSRVTVWTIENGIARSEQLPGLAIPGEPFLGLVGVAPSHARLVDFAQREAELARRGGVALPPDPESAVPAQGRPASEGLRTIPPRETGGNMDVKEVGVGARVLLPVDVPGALLSLGDMHFAQGDGESCGVAIEVSGRATVRTRVRPARESAWRPRYPAILYNDGEDGTGRPWIATTGIPIGSDGANADFDVYLAAQNAGRELVAYLSMVHGLTPEQGYVLFSVAANLRISSIVNAPNAVVSAHLPLDIFEEG